jgi:hypothetical protein
VPATSGAAARQRPGDFSSRRLDSRGLRQRRIQTGNPLGAGIRWQRAAVVIALGEIAAELRQQHGVGFALDTLGYHVQIEGVRHAHGGFDDDPVATPRAHAFDEGLVELQQVRRQIAQVAECGEAGAIVIDRHQHTEIVDIAHDAQRAHRIEHYRALGDLDLE